MYNPNNSKYLTVAHAKSNNGQRDVRIILDIDTNIFYTLDDDKNFIQIGSSTGGGSIIGGSVINNNLILNISDGSTITIPNICEFTLGELNQQINNVINQLQQYVQTYVQSLECCPEPTPTPIKFGAVRCSMTPYHFCNYTYDDGEVWMRLKINTNNINEIEYYNPKLGHNPADYLDRYINPLNYIN